jgi:peptide/nickel transport system substrate-binding protein
MRSKARKYLTTRGSDRKQVPRRAVVRGIVSAAMLGGVIRPRWTAGEARVETPQRGGILRFGVGDLSKSERLDPALATSASYYLVILIYDTLVRRTQDFRVTPALAESWEPNPGATSWTFHLRSGIRFHDGSAFSSRDVAWTLQRILDPKTGCPLQSRLASSLWPTGIKAIDERTVVLQLKRRDPFLPLALASYYAGIVKEGTSPGVDVATAIGTGPFRMKSFRAAESWEVVRNEHYWLPGLPYLDGVQKVTILDQTTRAAAVQADAVDIVEGLDFLSLKRLSADPRLHTIILPAMNFVGIQMDCSSKPFDDPRVRLALKLAHDRQRLLDTVYQGFGEVTGDVPVPMSDPYYPPALGKRGQNIERARQLLAESGYPNGIDIELATARVFPTFLDHAVAYASSVAPAGIRVSIRQWPADTYWDAQLQGRAGFSLTYWGRRFALDAIELGFADGSPFNTNHEDRSGWVRSALNKALAESNQNAQVGAVHEIFDHIANDSGFIISLFYSDVYAMTRSTQGNLTDTIPVPYYSLWKRG